MDLKYGQVMIRTDVEALMQSAIIAGAVEAGADQCDIGSVWIEKTVERLMRDLLTKIPATEPTFLLRAKDFCAPPSIAAYRDHCKRRGCDESHIGIVEDALTTMRDWQTVNADLVKLPD